MWAYEPFDMQVEDMLKRSFAEWRAQRGQPKALLQMQEVQKYDIHEYITDAFFCLQCGNICI